MKVLVACEYSGTVRDAFLRHGHEAVSCDLLPSESPGPHIVGDALDVLDDGWDLMIGHPPCTFLSNSGVRWLHTNPTRWDKMRNGAEFFLELLNAPIPHICIENPIPHKHANKIIGRHCDQVIQPWQFGHPESKATCLWLKRLPNLRATKVLKKPDCGHWSNQTPSGQNKLSPSLDRWKLRARTYEGIAEAMASQWNDLY